MVHFQDTDRTRPRSASSRGLDVQLSDNPDDAMSFPAFSAGPSIRPASRGKQAYTSHDGAQIDSSSTLGQFSFAPATQTTVVTTTTTTTTKFPPFVMRAARSMQDLDPKVYPLAKTSTPAALRTIQFDLAGKPTLFREAADATVAFEQVSLLQI